MRRAALHHRVLLAGHRVGQVAARHEERRPSTGPPRAPRRPSSRSTPAVERSDRTSASDGRCPRERGELDDRPVHHGLEADRVEHPLVERADVVDPLHHHRRPPRHVVLHQVGGWIEHDVRRHVPLVDTGTSGPDPSSTTRPPARRSRGPDRQPPQLAHDVGRSDRLLEPGHHEVPVAHRLRPERLHGRPLRSRHEAGSGVERGDPDRDRRRTQSVRQHQGPELGPVGDHDEHPLVLPGRARTSRRTRSTSCSPGLVEERPDGPGIGLGHRLRHPRRPTKEAAARAAARPSAATSA